MALAFVFKSMAVVAVVAHVAVVAVVTAIAVGILLGIGFPFQDIGCGLRKYRCGCKALSFHSCFSFVSVTAAVVINSNKKQQQLFLEQQ